MAHKKNILLVPVGWDGYIDPAVDEVRADETVDRPQVMQETVSDAGDGVLDRHLVTDTKKEIILSSITDYETAKTAGDTAAQLDALEVALTHMWDVMSGEDIGSALVEQQSQEGQ
jgi:hypothetical protein